MARTKTKTRVLVSLAMFDLPTFSSPAPTAEVFRVKRQGVPINEFEPLTARDYAPDGRTPLRDAAMRMLRVLDEVREENPDDVVIGLLADESGSMEPNRAAVIRGLNDFVAGMAEVDAVDPEAGGKVLCVIVTDGLENASREISPAQLAEATRQREEDGWTFIYLGANQDAWAEGTRTVGLSGSVRGQTVSYDSTEAGTYAAMASVTHDTQSYLADNKGYDAKREGSSNRRVSESGEETVVLPPDPPEPQVEPYGDVDAALRTARGKGGE